MPAINRIIFDLTDPSDPGSYFQFDAMNGVLQPMRPTTEVLERRGKRGHSVVLTGVRAPDSTLITMRYFADWDDPVAALASYVSLIDGDPVGIIMVGRDWGTFQVLDCLQAAPVTPIGVAAGTIEANPTCCQMLQWRVRNCDPDP